MSHIYNKHWMYVFDRLYSNSFLNEFNKFLTKFHYQLDASIANKTNCLCI